jgi:uncharacterized membrane protein YebE (DUF533 family)
MHKTIALAALVAAAFCATDAYAASKKQKKPEATQQKSSPPPSNNVYGPGCKNQGASIMSGGCVN